MPAAYRDKQTLVELYHEQDLTTAEIGERFGVSKTPIQKAMNELDVDTQKPRDKDLLDDLRRVATDGEAPSQAEYGEKGEYGQGTVQRRFDGWNNAMQRAGLIPNDASNHTDQELLNALESLADDLGRTPTQSDVREKCEYSVGAYYNHFGSLNDAKRKLGLEINHETGIERVTVKCANCGDKLKRLPSDVQQSEYDYCSQDCLNEHKQERYSGDGNPRWNKRPVQCEHCGATLYKANWERERREKFYCGDCWGDVTVTVECEWCGDEKDVWPSLTRVERHFCSPKCHGKWNSVHNTGEDHPRWRPGKRPTYYGPNWPVQRRRAMKRDQCRCQDCGVSEAQYMNKHGEALSVHHKTPFREFQTDSGWDYEAANTLENLVTVCRQCHVKREKNYG